MQKLLEKQLKDGSTLEIVRFCSPEEDLTRAPEWALSLFHYKLENWTEYYDAVFSGKTEGIFNRMYLGLVNGTPCSRMWFGYSARSGCGNFGNVLTLPEFRRRGIMRELLNVCVADIAKSGALFCSCDAATDAAPAYAAAGFRRIFSPELCPMVFVRQEGESFDLILKRAYSDIHDAVIRDGTLGDRFDCDKLLMYAPEVYGSVIPDAEIPSYLALWMKYVCEGKTKVKILETKTGFCAGYAALVEGKSCCVLHPGFTPYKAMLLKKAAE